MGAWGVRIFDNDTALDVQDEFHHRLKLRMTVKEALQSTVDGFKKSYYDEDVVFALVALQMKYNEVVNEELFTKAKEFAVDETRLPDWREPEERKKALDDFLKEIEKFEKESEDNVNVNQ
ncbi:hypothetical protein D3C81_333690 [compost metagenome]